MYVWLQRVTRLRQTCHKSQSVTIEVVLQACKQAVTEFTACDKIATACDKIATACDKIATTL